MQCPDCGSDNIKTPWPVTRGREVDSRRHICEDCNLVFETDARITRVHVRGARPGDRKRVVPLDEFRQR
jgi:RNA polymerase subunit RPABC4/transcription elongation factor Spt4